MQSNSGTRSRLSVPSSWPWWCISVGIGLLLLVLSTGGYDLGRSRYQCRQVGGLSATFDGRVEMVKLCIGGR
jgi:hypothetical protein